MKRWPVIRDVRCILVLVRVCWRAITIWQMTSVEQISESGLYAADLERARKILRGEL